MLTDAAVTAAGIIDEGVCHSLNGWIVANVGTGQQSWLKAPVEAFLNSMATGYVWCGIDCIDFPESFRLQVMATDQQCTCYCNLYSPPWIAKVLLLQAKALSRDMWGTSCRGLLWLHT